MAETATLEQAVPQVKTFETFDALKTAFTKDRELQKEFVAIQSDDAKVEEFLKTHVVPKDGGAQVAQPARVSTEPPDEEIVFTGKLKKSDFGTYLTNRKPEEAIAEMAKGNREKDATIEFLKREKLPNLESELAKEKQTREQIEREAKTFKEQLEAFKSKQAAAPAREKIEPVDLTDIDFLDEAGQKKAKDIIAAQQKALADSLAREEVLEGKISDIEARITNVSQSVETAGKEREIENRVEQQYGEIDNVRARHRDLFTSNRSVGDIEDDYLDFCRNLHAIAGCKGPLQDANGQFTPEARQAYDLYHDEEKGKALKAECDKRGVKLPEDMDDLLVTYRINAIKNEYAKRDPATGQYQPIPFDEALERYALSLETPEQRKLRDIKAGHDQYEKAVQNRAGFAKEIPATAASAPVDMSKVGLDEFQALIHEYHNQKKNGTVNPELKLKLEHIIRASQGGSDELVGQLLGA